MLTAPDFNYGICVKCKQGSFNDNKYYTYTINKDSIMQFRLMKKVARNLLNLKWSYIFNFVSDVLGVL